METFFGARGYPNDLIRSGRERASIKSRAELLENNAGNNTTNDRVPLVTTFHPMNQDACKIISGNFRILHDDSTTNNIFRKPPLKEVLIRSSLPHDPPNHQTGTFPCNRTVCRTCPHVNSSNTIATPKGRARAEGGAGGALAPPPPPTFLQ